MNNQYTNALTPEILAEMAESPFTAEQLAKMDDEALRVIEEQTAYNLQHPVNAIFRLATEGSLTRKGGVVRAVYSGLEIELEDGSRVNVAREGDEAVYPDGGTARIISGAGKASQYQERSVALVGSALDNGDEIVSTPQASCYKVTRAGIAPEEDFLTVAGA
ncbi:PAAR domain-containing protein [Brenneria goodwinii]|uniref:hypothetical protein n=1 Tax=Brenneria goodwinii TaxID=1109412 RepID=UPI0036EA0E05